MADHCKMANINITQIRMKRGNTAASSTYTGPLGELLVDTGLKTIRVQDGVTPGGMSILATNAQVWALSNSISTIAGVDTTLLANAATQQSQINTFNANLGSFQAYANSTFVAGNYSNTNVSAYLSGQNITSANIGAFQTYANLNISELQSNASTQTVDINLVNANVTSANAAITSLQSNAATQAGILDTLTANAATQSTVLDTLISNAATQASTLTTLLSNAATQQTSLTDLLANAATQADSINTLQTQVYANANVAAYLPTYTGDIAANIVKNGYTWRFGTNGTTQFPGSQILAPAGESITMQSDQYSQLMWENANVTVAPNMAINSNFYVAQNNATLDIGYRDGSSTQLIKTWLWSVDGSLTLPAGGTITEGGGISGAIRLTPAGGANSNQALVIYPTGNAEGDHVHLTAGGGSTELYLGNDLHYVKLVDGGNIELRAATANLSAQASWEFDTTGNIDARQALGIKVPNGVPSNVAVINSTTGSWESNPNLSLATTGGSGTGLTVNVADTGGYASTIEIATAGTGYTNGDLITVTSGTSNATFTIVIGGRNSWRFDTNGNLTLPETGYLRVGSGIVAGFASSPAPVISGFSSISAVNLGASGNVLAGGQVIANGVIESGAGFSTGGYLSVDGSADLHNTTVTGNISATGNVTGGNIITAGNVSGNTAGFTIGYRDIPQVSFTGNATLAATDAGKHYYSTLATANVLTIANNTSVSWSVGTAVTIVNRGSGNITVAQGSGVSLYLAGNSTASNRTVTTYGMATLLNVAANVWMINGTGVS
jgi:hypothetical protein